jgi:hypothetical protein
MRVAGQRSSGIVLDYVATATLDDDPPLLKIVGRRVLRVQIIGGRARTMK